MDEPRDTIAAIATATGVGGVGIVRVSGPGALGVAAALTGRALSAWPERRLVRVRVRDGAGTRIDDGLAVAMRGPGSFTGDDVVELQVHGGAVNLGKVLGAVIEAGARAAEPGEFTRRALAAGKIGLLEAEAMLAVVHAQSERGWELAQRQLGGALASRVADLRSVVAAVLAEIEAGIDFPEEDLTPASRAELVGRVRGLAEACRGLAGSFGAGRALTDGLTVALVGHVNAGKSSLLNALAGRERALVSPEPGTTRDWVEARVMWRGVAVTLVDTAGLRDEASAAGGLEQRGIELGRRRAAEAHVVLAVVAPEGPGPAAETLADARTIVVASKADLGHPHPGQLATSAVTGEGIERLRAAVLARVGVVDDVEAGGVVVLTERQRATAAAAAAAMGLAGTALDEGAPGEIVALELRAGAEALAQLEGDRVGEEVLDQLFARFCIGK